MVDRRPPDLAPYASPPRRDLSYEDIDPEGSQPLDTGGQAWVYEVTLDGPDPPDRVAVRELPQTATDGISQTSKFLDQARTWATLDQRERTKPRWADYEHIVGVVDVGDDLPWVAMEYMDGGSLADRLADHPDGLPIAEAFWIGECVCRALEVAHGYGVVHLDLKPSNVLFRETSDDQWDVPKLADWGLSRRLLDETGSIEGLSAPYAAPEQFDSDSFGDPDKLTDIYQVGALLYAIFTGAPPYTGSRLSIMREVLGDATPVPPSERRSALPQALDDVILGALTRDKSDRIRTIEQVQRQLSAAADRANQTERRVPPTRRRRQARPHERRLKQTDGRRSGGTLPGLGMRPTASARPPPSRLPGLMRPLES